jgi:phage terminase large subunit-like protein
LFSDDRVNTPKVFTAANNEDQAKICVNIAGQIAAISDEIQEKADVKFMRYGESIISVLNEDKGKRGNGFIKALSKEGSDRTSKTAGGKHGINASLGVVDEFGMSPDHGNSKTIESSMVSRPERLMLYITTAGYNMDGPCYKELRESGIKVLEGVIEMDSYFMMIFEIDKPVVDGKEEDITIEWLLANEDRWGQSNPNLDVSVDRDALRDTLKDARQYGGVPEVECKILNFNIWVQSAATFIPVEIWDKNAHGLEAFGSCYAGLEIARAGEVSALALCFPGDVTAFNVVHFADQQSVDKNDFYMNNKGLIRIDPGNQLENSVAVELIAEELNRYSVYSVGYPAGQNTNTIIQELVKLGFDFKPVPQKGNEILDVTETWEKMLHAGEVEHFNNPILKWQNSNCLAVRKPTGTRIEKTPSVIGIYACLNAIYVWKKHPEINIGILSIQ